MILGFAHAGLVVPDLERAVRFYRTMFGFRELSSADWRNSPEMDRAIGVDGSAGTSVMLAGHNCFLELFRYEAPVVPGAARRLPQASEPGIRHLAFFVDDCEREYARLVALGGQVLGEPLANRSGRMAVYARDPFGNIVELCEPPDELETLQRLPGVSAADAYQGPPADLGRDLHTDKDRGARE